MNRVLFCFVLCYCVIPGGASDVADEADHPADVLQPSPLRRAARDGDSKRRYTLQGVGGRMQGLFDSFVIHDSCLRSRAALWTFD